MKTLLIGSVLGTVLATSALAADLPARVAPPAVPVPLFTWTGFYLGAQVGAAWQQDRLSETSVCVPTCVDTATGKAAGVVGGGHAGYNWQTGPLVLGIEGDIEGTSLHHATFYPLSFPDTFSARTLWQGSVRGRLGYAIGQILIYGTGGVAFGDIRHTYFEAISGTTESFTHGKAGWTAGGGVEYAFTQNWSARVEYRYTDFGRTSDVPGIAFPGFIEHHHETEQAVRVGVSYRFGWNAYAPVVARY